MKLPVRAPAAIEHDCEAKRFAGVANIVHVVPKYPVPVTVTVVPTWPKTGLRTNVATVGTVNDADAKSPMVPVTLTVYGPLAALATTKDPDILPPTTLHSGLEMRPLGVEEIAHPVSRTLKPLPVTRTFVPTSPTVGNKSIFAVTVKVAIPKSLWSAPVTVTVDGPGGAPVLTVNDPVTVPPRMSHCAAGTVATAGPVIEHSKLPVEKPVPETAMTAPMGP